LVFAGPLYRIRDTALPAQRATEPIAETPEERPRSDPMSLYSLAAPLVLASIVGAADDPPATEKTGQAKAETKANPGTETKATPGTEKDKASTTPKAPKMEKATFGGGCFWCMEAVFERLPGVKSVVSGFAGGEVPNPTYQLVLTGLTGHAEVIQIEYDAEKITYEQLLDVFWKAHDPTTLNAQGPDFGTQYRSIILFHNESQRQAALKSHKALVASRHYRSPIVTELVPLTIFYPAEDYHQDYYRNHKEADYCQMVIAPKLRKLKLPR
jgi:peptide-methionine (S)-S-oxide reductase